PPEVDRTTRIRNRRSRAMSDTRFTATGGSSITGCRGSPRPGTDRPMFEISELRPAQDESSYRLLVENASDAIFTLGPDGTLRSLNPAFERITGWPRSAWLGRPFAPLVHPEDLPVAKQLF